MLCQTEKVVEMEACHPSQASPFDPADVTDARCLATRRNVRDGMVVPVLMNIAAPEALVDHAGVRVLAELTFRNTRVRGLCV